MAIWNLGSINADHFYHLPHIPAPGETLAAHALTTGLGGKGANMSVACARAGARCHHIGRVGADGIWARDRLMEYGIDTRFIEAGKAPTGHAIIALAEDGENAITLFAGANRNISTSQIGAALSEAAAGDWFVTQNETNGQVRAATQAKKLGLKLAYAAAPFEAEAVEAMLPLIDLLILNAVEMAQLQAALGRGPEDLNLPTVIVTKGPDGVDFYQNGAHSHAPAIPVTPVDTTGAGDTFTGYTLAGLDRGLSLPQSLRLASHAAALMVTRQGTADVIPDLREVQQAMGNH